MAGIPKEKKWYAIYVKSRHEKIISERLNERNIKNYLPMQKILKQWADRKKWIEEPMFKSYLFVRIGYKDYIKTYETDGVVTFVNFSGNIEAIPDDQIKIIKRVIDSDFDVEVSSKELKKGDIVLVKTGSLKGIKGSLVELHGKHKVAIEIEGIGQTMLAEVPLKFIKKVEE
ncbi:MAG: UpxY family transcription antiterminator [Bacteroidota bacterium]|nr:UpxY family transcription antiterminator [Bacteroidota bacterium]